MCGICGFNRNDKSLVTRMADQIIHRGPRLPELSDTLMHLSGYIFRAAIDEGLRRK